jgi:CheY-like chemotaxis protein
MGFVKNVQPGTALLNFAWEIQYPAPMPTASFYATLHSGPRLSNEVRHCSIFHSRCEKANLAVPLQEADPISSQPMTRVLILDDQPGFRKQLSSLITFSGLEVAGEAGSVPEALELLPSIGADLAIVDIDLPGLNGIEGTPLLKKAAPGLRVILVSAYADQSALFMEAAVRVGAECFISKDRLDPDVIMSWNPLFSGFLSRCASH